MDNGVANQTQLPLEELENQITELAARRLSCDASVVAVVENDNGEPLSVGRKTRIIPPALRRALNTRDEGCRFPGCTYHRYVDAHHVRHWADGGETKLSNLITLCRAHHRMVHKGEIKIEKSADGGGSSSIRRAAPIAMAIVSTQRLFGGTIFSA